MAAPSTKQLPDPPPSPLRPNLSLMPSADEGDKDDIHIKFEEGAMKIDHPDGSVTIDFNPDKSDVDEGGFYENLAKRMDDGELARISTDLLDGIQRDDDSRKEWLETRALGINLLGLKLEKPRSDAGTTSAPLEGMSTVRHPLLLGAVVSFQANARAELMPASGPVKVRNDTTAKPFVADPQQPTDAARELEDTLQAKDDLADALERDMNHYLTATATEYYPDTDRMLFYVAFGGDGFKKVHHCPLRNRPVSESVDAEDLIVSHACTDLQNSARITHHIRMRRSVLRRMQILGTYRDIELGRPPQPKLTVVDRKKEEVDGRISTFQAPEDREYDIYETYCELDLDDYAPKQFRGKCLPLPYRVTLERDSRQVLDVRRNWKEDDEQCRAKQWFVQFPFIRGLGFYGLGFIHLLGNATNTLTAAWRETLDAGMFANFPGFLHAKGLGRQNTNQFRVAPGTGVGIDLGAQQSIRDAVMPLPYKDPSGPFIQFMTHVEEVGNKLAGTANLQVGEGKQDAPVGTTLALIEQASKVMDSAHKRLHAAQAEEFKLLKERFREDPEAFWRHSKKPVRKWVKDQFIEALNRCELVPVADPNNPTSLHRMAKAQIIKMLQMQSPMLYDPRAVDLRIYRITDIDPQGLFQAQPQQPPPDPRMEAITQKAQQQAQQNQVAQLEAQIKAAEAAATIQDKQRERESRERIEQMKLQLEAMRVNQERIIHAHDIVRDNAQAQSDMSIDAAQHQQEMQHNQAAQLQKIQHDHMERMQGLRNEQMQQEHEMRGGMVRARYEMQVEREKHQAAMERDRQEHAMKMEQMREEHEHKLKQAQALNEAKVEAAKAIAKSKPKPAAKGSSNG